MCSPAVDESVGSSSTTALSTLPDASMSDVRPAEPV
jgi:hypothetical protein